MLLEIVDKFKFTHHVWNNLKMKFHLHLYFLFRYLSCWPFGHKVIDSYFWIALAFGAFVFALYCSSFGFLLHESHLSITQKKKKIAKLLARDLRKYRPSRTINCDSSREFFLSILHLLFAYMLLDFCKRFHSPISTKQNSPMLAHNVSESFIFFNKDITVTLIATWPTILWSNVLFIHILFGSEYLDVFVSLEYYFLNPLRFMWPFCTS